MVEEKNEFLRNILQKFGNVFQEELPDDFPPHRGADRVILIL